MGRVEITGEEEPENRRFVFKYYRTQYGSITVEASSEDEARDLASCENVDEDNWPSGDWEEDGMEEEDIDE